MNDRVAAGHDPLEQRLVADVPLDLLEPGMTRDLREYVVAIDVQVEHFHPVAVLEQARHEHRSDVSGAAGHEHGVER